ncbi:MAG: helix-turn-helix transcriptional regulator [Alkaliphilus sp.]
MDTLKNHRNNLGYSQQIMANKIGVSKSFYEKIEKGDRQPSRNFMLLFASAFPDANIQDIFFNRTTHETCSDPTQKGA